MNEIPEIASFLRRLPAFGGLDELLNSAAGALSIAYYRRGADILTIGSRNTRLNLVRSGAVELRKDADARQHLFRPALHRRQPAKCRPVPASDWLRRWLPGAETAFGWPKSSPEPSNPSDSGNVMTAVHRNCRAVDESAGLAGQQ